MKTDDTNADEKLVKVYQAGREQQRVGNRMQRSEGGHTEKTDQDRRQGWLKPRILGTHSMMNLQILS